MTNRDFAMGRSTPDGLPRLGHWRRPTRRNLQTFVGASTAVAEVPRPQPAAALPASGLSPEEAAVLEELDITPDPTWLTTAAPAAAPPAIPERAEPVAAPTARSEGLVADLQPANWRSGPAVERLDRPDYGLGRHWGATWQWTAQGWVDRDGPNPTWRPVVSTTGEISNWEHDTYLGVVTGQAAVRWTADATMLGRALAEGRETAMQGMVDAGVARGAHAVVGVDVSYTEVEATVLVTATGTAVTLRER